MSIADLSHLYEESGGDPTRCEICDDPLDDTRPWKRGLDGAGAHVDCLDTDHEEEEDRDG